MILCIDVSNPPCICDSDVAGPGATLNINIDLMNVDVDVPFTHESIQRLSRSSSQAANSSAIALDHLF